MNQPRLIHRSVFGAAVACALGFGTAQVFASPAPAAAPPTCIEEECNADCQARGYMGGYCELDRYCMCSVPIQP